MHTRSVTENPVVRRMQLGQILAGARERAGVSREGAAEVLSCHPATIGRIERGGAARVRPAELHTLLDLYGVTDKAVRETCEALARGKEAGWWQPYNSALREEYRRLIGLESAASDIRTFQSAVFPGILQTPEYASEVIRASIPTVPPDVLEARVSVRMARQGRLLTSGGPRVHAVLDEGVLLRRVGGLDVWKAQLAHTVKLIRAAPRLSLLVQVLRFDAGAPPTVNGSFMLLHLRDTETDAWVAYTESPTGDRYEERADADIHLTVFDKLMQTAVSPNQTIELIEKILWENS